MTGDLALSPPDDGAGSSLRVRFSGHQTFPFRYPWLPKAIQGVLDDPSLFFDEEAVVRLGVGRNMVASMRFWCEALDLAEFDARSSSARATPLGAALFALDGWDPFLESVATLWVLQWRLASAAERATTWHMVFSRWYKDTFSREELATWVARTAAAQPGVRATLGTIRRDVDTFVRTYVPADGDGGRRPLEDAFDSPLVELGLVTSADGHQYACARRDRPTLPVEILAYALAEYWERAAATQESLSFERILYDIGSPGAAFRLSEGALVAHLDALPAWTGLRYDETAGLRTVFRDRRAVARKPLAILKRYYEESDMTDQEQQ